MELKQALEVLTQAINIAVGSGTFKTTKDVSIINVALDTILRFEQEQNASKEVEAIGPKKEK